MRRCRLLRRRGQTAVERAIWVAMIALVAAIVLTLVGTKVRNVFSTLNTSINTTVDGGSSDTGGGDDDDDDDDDDGGDDDDDDDSGGGKGKG